MTLRRLDLKFRLADGSDVTMAYASHILADVLLGFAHNGLECEPLAVRLHPVLLGMLRGIVMSWGVHLPEAKAPPGVSFELGCDVLDAETLLNYRPQPRAPIDSEGARLHKELPQSMPLPLRLAWNPAGELPGGKRKGEVIPRYWWGGRLVADLPDGRQASIGLPVEDRAAAITYLDGMGEHVPTIAA